jgi:hypothetical protein
MLNPFAQNPKESVQVKVSLLLYLFLSLLAFYPCLFLGQAYFDNDLLAQFGPWRAFLKDQLARGHIPLWNPYSLGGQPFFADLQNMMLYPLNYLTLPFSVPMGLSVFFFIHLFWAAFGMHLWLKSLGLSENSCRVGALLFAFSGFFWLELVHPPVLAAFAWLPWLFVRLEQLAKNPKPLNAFTAGFCFAMLFLCGSFQVTVGAFYGGLAYFFFRFLLDGKKTSAANLSAKSFFFLSLFLLWGALPLVGQLIPSLEFSALTVRRAPDQTYEQSNSRLPLNPATLYQFFLPRLTVPEGKEMAEAIQFGNTNEDNHLAANLGYLGVWVPFFILLAFRHKEKRLVRYLGGFTLFSLLLCFGRYTPLHRILCAILPGLSIIRVPYRFLFLYILAASALAAFGFEQQLSENPSKTKIFQGLKIPLVYAFVLYLAALFRPSMTWREILGLTLGITALFLSAFTKSKLKLLSSLLLAIALVLPLLLSGMDDFKPAPASNFDFAQNSKSLVEGASRIKPYRLIFYNSQMGYPIKVDGRDYILNYPQNAACALKIKNFGGYNPLMLQIKKDIGTLPLKPLVQLGAIRGVVTEVAKGTMPDFKLESFPPYFIYEYQKPLPYAYAPQKLVVESDANRRLGLLQNPGFDATQTGVLSEPFPTQWMNSLETGKPAGLQSLLEKDESDDQSFSLTLDRSNLVVFCEVMYPGWKAFIDGQPTPIYTADHFLRAIYAPAGPHQVEFRFDPAWWLPIREGLAIWLLVTLAGLFFAWRPGKGVPGA